MLSQKNRWLKILLFAAYIALTLFVSLHHEPWRDEFADLSIAMESRTIGDLFYNFKTEGFPFLWYFVLWIGFKIFPHMAVLKIASLSIAFLAVGIFLWASPFSLWQKTLWIFGFFPAYQYSVVCRSYGLSMLLLFGICALYKDRWKKILPFSVLLFLFSNTNVHSLIISIALCLSLSVEWMVQKPALDSREKRNLKMGILIIAGGLMASFLQVYPDPDSIVKIYDYSWAHFLKILPKAFTRSGNLFVNGLGFPLPLVWLLTPLLWIFYTANFSNRWIGIFYFAAGMGLSYFFLMFYPGMQRHQGFLYLLMTAGLWMEKEIGIQKFSSEKWEKIFEMLRKIRGILFIIFLFLQVGLAYDWAARDLAHPFTANKLLAEYLQTHPEYREAVLIPEPDFLAVSAGYYVPNKIYLPRQHEYATRVQYSKRNDMGLTMTQLMDAAARIRKETQKPVLIIFGHVMPEDKNEITFSYYKTFRCNQNERIQFFQKTRKIAIFIHGVISDEKYEVYEWMPASPPDKK